MLLVAIRRKTECPRRVSVSPRAGFDSRRLHCFPRAFLLVGHTRGQSGRTDRLRERDHVAARRQVKVDDRRAAAVVSP
jgi:hypothetical protein